MALKRKEKSLHPRLHPPPLPPICHRFMELTDNMVKLTAISYLYFLPCDYIVLQSQEYHMIPAWGDILWVKWDFIM